MTVRVRIAPSPTGYVHVGNVRAALFNWLYARHHAGTFILRIDDTDVERSETLFEDDIKEGFRWLGLDWDEGVDVGGPHGSYRQSDRFDHYRDAALDLVERGLAYYDNRTPDALEALRGRAVAEKRHPNTYIRRPETPASSGAIRFSVPQDQAVEFFDLVRDDMRFEAETIDDFVILRSDGAPTYHLASTVDDVDYQISHVARGEDLLSSTPKHILLTRALGGIEPTYAHLPLLFGPDGKKLSKRHGDTSLKAYREGGYLPAAMLNFLATLGWSFDADRTLFTVEEAVAAFDLGDVAKNSAVFDVGKLAWINGEYIRSLPVGTFRAVVEGPVTAGFGRPLTSEEWARVNPVLPLVQERTKLLTEVAGQIRFLIDDDIEYDLESWDKVMTREGVGEILSDSLGRLEELDRFEVEPIEEALRAMLQHLGLGAAKGLQPVRVAITGTSVSPPLFESIAALGKPRTVARLRRSLQRL
jgi:glutamyl-tRNA synthetase